MIVKEKINNINNLDINYNNKNNIFKTFLILLFIFIIFIFSTFVLFSIAVNINTDTILNGIYNIKLYDIFSMKNYIQAALIIVHFPLSRNRYHFEFSDFLNL